MQHYFWITCNIILGVCSTPFRSAWNTRAKRGQGQNLRAKYSGKWRRGQNKRAKIQHLSEKIDVDHKKSGTTLSLSYFQWNVMEQTERAKRYLKNWESLNISCFMNIWFIISLFWLLIFVKPLLGSKQEGECPFCQPTQWYFNKFMYA